MNGIKTAFLLGTLTMLLGAVGMLFDRMLGTGGMMTILFLGIGIVMNWVSYFYSDKIVLKMYKAQPVTPQQAPDLHAMVDKLCARLQMPKPVVCILPTDVPNAFATGRNPSHAAVACTQGLMRALSRDELEAVVAHELGHIKNRDTLVSTVAASIAGAIGMMGQMGQFGAIFGGSRDNQGGGNPIALLVVAIAAPIIAMMVQMAISRTREYGADRAAAQMTGNPAALASALRRIESFSRGYQMPTAKGTQHMFIINPLSGGMKGLFSTHPPTEKRIAALMKLQMPGNNSQSKQAMAV